MNPKKTVCLMLVFLRTGPGNDRGCSSSYVVVTDMSLVIRKVLDAEVMSNECRECITWSSKKAWPEITDMIIMLPY
jgi:hypothetical protein